MPLTDQNMVEKKNKIQILQLTNLKLVHTVRSRVIYTAVAHKILLVVFASAEMSNTCYGKQE